MIAETPAAPRALPRRMIRVAVLSLPAAHRDRYRREFTADLHHLLSREQLRYATRVLCRSWGLRAALGPSPVTRQPLTEGIVAVKKKQLRCRLGRHQYVEAHSPDEGSNGPSGRLCLRCGKRTSVDPKYMNLVYGGPGSAGGPFNGCGF